MSKQAIIGINGDPIPFDETIDKIQTQGIGGGTIDWVPEDDVQLTELTVTVNGTYTPSGTVYGFSDVSVSVPGTEVSGYMNGVHYVVTLDSDGNLVFTPD